MTEQQIINELDSIIAYADGMKSRATGLRKKLSRLYGPTSRKRAKVISDEEIAKVLAGRRAFLNRKAEKIQQQEQNKKLYNAERRVEYNIKRLQKLKAVDEDNG